MTGKQLSWWTRLDDANRNRWWATGLRGRYVVELDGDDWYVLHQRRNKWRQLGIADTAKEARELAQADFELRSAPLP
jgi:hypothetical protein